MTGETGPENNTRTALFQRSSQNQFPGSRITADGGLILVRELDERLGFGDFVGRTSIDSGRRNPLADPYSQSACRRLAGYEDVNGAERLSQEPTFRLIGSEKI